MEHWRELELKTGLSFREKEGSLLIKPRLMLNRFDIGALLLFVVGFCLIVIALWKTDNAFDFYVVLGFGVILEIGGALATIKTLSDFLLITDSEIVFRNSLKEKKLKIEQGLKVKVKTKKIRSRTRNWHKSTISVDIYIKRNGNKYRIIDFLAERKDRDAADFTGKLITAYINKKIEAV